MKKIKKKQLDYLILKNKRGLRKKELIATKLQLRIMKQKKKHKKIRQEIINDPLHEIKRLKKRFQNTFYSKRKYNKGPLDIKIEGEFGIEYNFTEFIKISSSFIESKSKLVTFHLKNCTRIWPSAITLLCSFKQWTEITAKKGFASSIFSTNPLDNSVNEYLAHCGFYEYVNAERKDGEFNAETYDDKKIVKIKREKNKSEINILEKDIGSILESFSTLTKEQKEDFDCNVLIEVFNNATEHGHSYKDNGWWTLTQYHQSTGIIKTSAQPQEFCCSDRENFPSDTCCTSL